MQDMTDKSARELFGDGCTAESTRDRLLDAALDLFYVHGFHAVGLDQIIERVGVTKTTFYNHFESKDELIIAAIDRRDQWEGESYQQRVLEIGGDEPRTCLFAIFDVLNEYFTSPDFKGCIFLNACAEFPSPSDPVHQRAAEHYTKAEAMLTEFAERAGASDPQGLARQLIILVEGALTRRYVSHDNDAAKSAKHVAELVVTDYLAAAS